MYVLHNLVTVVTVSIYLENEVDEVNRNDGDLGIRLVCGCWSLFGLVLNFLMSGTAGKTLRSGSTC